MVFAEISSLFFYIVTIFALTEYFGKKKSTEKVKDIC